MYLILVGTSVVSRQVVLGLDRNFRYIHTTRLGAVEPMKIWLEQTISKDKFLLNRKQNKTKQSM